MFNLTGAFMGIARWPNMWTLITAWIIGERSHPRTVENSYEGPYETSVYPFFHPSIIRRIAEGRRRGRSPHKTSHIHIIKSIITTSDSSTIWERLKQTSFRLSVCLSVCLSVYLSVRLSVYLSVCHRRIAEGRSKG
jgi:hypothetical protein